MGHEWFKEWLEAEIAALGGVESRFAERTGLSRSLVNRWRSGMEPRLGNATDAILALGGDLARALPTYTLPHPAADRVLEENDALRLEVQRLRSQLEQIARIAAGLYPEPDTMTILAAENPTTYTVAADSHRADGQRRAALPIVVIEDKGDR